MAYVRDLRNESGCSTQSTPSKAPNVARHRATVAVTGVGELEVTKTGQRQKIISSDPKEIQVPCKVSESNQQRSNVLSLKDFVLLQEAALSTSAGLTSENWTPLSASWKAESSHNAPQGLWDISDSQLLVQVGRSMDVLKHDLQYRGSVPPPGIRPAQEGIRPAGLQSCDSAPLMSISGRDGAHCSSSQFLSSQPSQSVIAGMAEAPTWDSTEDAITAVTGDGDPGSPHESKANQSSLHNRTNHNITESLLFDSGEMRSTVVKLDHIFEDNVGFHSPQQTVEQPPLGLNGQQRVHGQSSRRKTPLRSKVDRRTENMTRKEESDICSPSCFARGQLPPPPTCVSSPRQRMLPAPPEVLPIQTGQLKQKCQESLDTATFLRSRQRLCASERARSFPSLRLPSPPCLTFGKSVVLANEAKSIQHADPQEVMLMEMDQDLQSAAWLVRDRQPRRAAVRRSARRSSPGRRAASALSQVQENSEYIGKEFRKQPGGNSSNLQFHAGGQKQNVSQVDVAEKVHPKFSTLTGIDANAYNRSVSRLGSATHFRSVSAQQQDSQEMILMEMDEDLQRNASIARSRPSRQAALHRFYRHGHARTSARKSGENRV
eukprot:gnl/MRDRNA2_/MRDRNA2_31359_c0_seq1.p1 gnl/MRDRNA2_/MRDRNA2_31359_c0~~gnl/MRDRNA2_/MRDRNA2_31359_c0_seq1.p1  ORF type:complete len:626 (-),score=88.24 gnl/MRDRNA2_/MRDRNA2_31359_c0_seq1:54-1862(-)